MDGVAAGLSTLSRFRSSILDAYPLTTAKLWHRANPRTSQRRAVQAALGDGVRYALILGGNRSGKTEAGAMLSVAYALGRDHPAVRVWGKANRLDLSAIQEGPGVVCCSALTSNDSVRVQRPKVTTYLPAGTGWSNQYGHGEARARLPGGGTLIFKSNDQRARSFQGAEWDFWWCDEEHDQPVSNEGRVRLVDRSGRVVSTMTPLLGKSWVWERFVDEPEPGSVTVSLSSRDNPHIPVEYLDELLSRYGPHERAARERGVFTSLEGRVYEDWRHDLHVIPSHPIPESWPRYQGWDFGTRNPACVLWCALDTSDNTLHVYREVYRAGLTIRQLGERILRIEQCQGCGSAGCDTCDGTGRTEPAPEWRVADPAAKGERHSLAREHELRTVKARNQIRPGISSVAERLAPDANGNPHLLVHDCCRHLINEMEGYVWNVTRSKADGPDVPLKRNDHAMDALRYICFRLQRSEGGYASA